LNTATFALLALAAGQPVVAHAPAGASAAETRVVDYLRTHVQPGQPVVVSELYNGVLSAPEERAALQRLFNLFFKLPLLVARQQRASGRPPTLAEISEQLQLDVPGEADVLLRVMEADPRVPRFFERDARSGELTRVDVEAILAHPRFGRALERTIGGWEGRPAPALAVTGYDGLAVGAPSLAGRAQLRYFWFSGCPPCLRSSPLLVALQQELGPLGLEVVALNADRALEIGTGDTERAEYARRQGWSFTLAHASPEALEAHGAVSVFPTFFFVDRHGVIVKQLLGFQTGEALRAAGRLALQ
jgi:thiol-disulfide isomerase/thioredoxin